MKVQELMTSEIQSIEPTTSLQEAARFMRDWDVGSLPIINNGKLLGMITDRDICCQGLGADRDPKTTQVSDIMSTDVSSCFVDQDISEAAHLMEDKHIRRLAVLNRDNNIVGLMSVDDLARGSHDLAGEVLELSASMH
jgi:CBS domain-containing protein